MYLLLIAATCLAVASAGNFPTDFNCTGLQNGLAWWGCRSYGRCDNGEHDQTDCVNGTAYDQLDGICVPEDSAAWPCNRVADCTALNSTVHRIPELDSQGEFEPCRFYYTCNYGNYAGHQMCGQGLVYSEEAQNCLTPEFVPPPCGTLNAL
ncbi:uncharacterized protein [Haliotis cracherodii]|uniref:uncharacterized protein n=1 Tax=Haliotis cracherodii TaxID=6455 RepID=UPI0039ED6D68